MAVGAGCSFSLFTGAQGVGRSMLATCLAQELVNSQHWTDAYWIDMQGISNVVLAGQQLMAGLGLVGDVCDTQQLLAWLEGRPRERFGIVLTHVQDLVMAPAEEHQGFLDLLDNILHVGCSGRQHAAQCLSCVLMPASGPASIMCQLASRTA